VQRGDLISAKRKAQQCEEENRVTQRGDPSNVKRKNRKRRKSAQD